MPAKHLLSPLPVRKTDARVPLQTPRSGCRVAKCGAQPYWSLAVHPGRPTAPPCHSAGWRTVPLGDRMASQGWLGQEAPPTWAWRKPGPQDQWTQSAATTPKAWFQTADRRPRTAVPVPLQSASTSGNPCPVPPMADMARRTIPPSQSIVVPTQDAGIRAWQDQLPLMLVLEPERNKGVLGGSAWK